MAKKRRTPPRGRGGRFRRAGRRRRNPPVAVRRRTRRANPPRRRRRSNPRRSLKSLFALPPFARIAAATAGMAGSRVVPGYVARMLPGVPLTGAGGLAVRAAIGLGLGAVVGMVAGRRVGEDVTFGAVLSVADEAAQQFLYPSIGLGAYIDAPNTLGAYLPTDRPGRGLYPELSPGMGASASPESGATVARLDSRRRF